MPTKLPLALLYWILPEAVATRLFEASNSWAVAFLVVWVGVLLLNDELVGFALSPASPMPSMRTFNANAVPTGVTLGEALIVGERLGIGVVTGVAVGCCVSVNVDSGVAVGVGDVVFSIFSSPKFLSVIADPSVMVKVYPWAFAGSVWVMFAGTTCFTE